MVTLSEGTLNVHNDLCKARALAVYTVYLSARVPLD